MILADSSAWVEFDRATGSDVHLHLKEVMRGGRLAVTDAVAMELLAGARDEQRAVAVARMLRAFHWLPAEPSADFQGAARIYRLCRSAGVTPRGLVDCLIVNVALRTRSTLLAADAEFENIARVVPLRLERPR